MTDIVTGKRYAATGGSRANGALGPGWQSGNTGTYIIGPTGTEANATGNYRVGSGVSVVVAGRFTTGSVSSIPISNCFAAGSGGWTLKSEQYNNTGQVGFGSFGAGSDYSSGIATPTRDGSILSLQMQLGANTKYRVNLNSTANSANDVPAVTGDQITVGAGWRLGSANDEMNSGDIVYWAAIYSRDVPDQHIMRWHTRPFGDIIVSDISRAYFFPTAGAGGFQSAFARNNNAVVYPHD